MNISKRVTAPTPKFFKVLRNIGLVLAGVGGSILAAPIALPVVMTTLGGYLVVAGGVASAVSQLTIKEDEVTRPFDSAKDRQAQDNHERK
ncbi:hypothetical protein [Flavobacterium sp.]|uniref:hypothetical protein n=1 Tax=Flavobacterium sp. TaxID=239 RepID=UPI00391DE480